MAVALETVVKQLEDSGIVAAGKLENFVPPKAHPSSVEELVRELVKENHLTKFQAQQIAGGKVKALILGGYTVLDKIGAGGMGQVFKAQHRKMERLVAIKMLPPAMTKDAAALARFQREVVAAAKLRHPNIVAADDAAEANGVHFLVMEYVEGSDLSALVKKHGPFSVAKAVNYVLQAARGLEFAHKKGVIHRDIKPANLLLDHEGTVKILDMGLARIEGDGAAQAELTGTGAVMGTVDYMAPEQALSTKHADARADIYSLGCSLYYLIAGKATYDGDTLMAKLMAHSGQPIPSLREGQAEVSEQLETVFKKMVAKKIEDRYQTMSEVIADLEKCQLGIGNEAASTVMGRWQSSATIDPSELSIALGNQNLKSISTPDFSIQLSEPRPKPTKKTAKPSSEGGSKNKKPLLIGAGAAGFFALLLGVIVILRNQKGEEVGRMELPGGTSVEVRSTTPRAPSSAVASSVPAIGNTPPLAKAAFDAKQAKAYQTVWAKHLGTQIETTNSVGMRMTLIPPGEFLMGSTPEQVAWGRTSGEDEKVPTTSLYFERLAQEMPQHKVTISQPFLMGSTEVTVGQFRKFFEATKYVTEAEQAKDADKGKNWKSPGYAITDDTAVTHICWNDAAAFCEWLTKQERNEPRPLGSGPLTDVRGSSAVYRLPTEAEWEYGCRAGTTSQYSFGDDTSQLEQYGWYIKNNRRGAQPVALKLSNPFGLFDIHGNVTEWCQDLGDGKWYEKSPPIDPNGPSIGSTRVIRGGSWPYGASYCRSAARGSDRPSYKFSTSGFRCVRPLDASKPETAVATTANPNAQPTKPTQPWETPAFQAWIKATQSLPAEQQIEAVSKKLMELNPGFNGKLSGVHGASLPRIEQGVVTELRIVTDHVIDISPLRVLKGLSKLMCTGSGGEKGRLSDLSPLAEFTLTELSLGSTQVSDLSPLEGMKLEYLYCYHTPLSNLSPIRGVPLTRLDCQGTRITDLSPLRSMKLVELGFTPANITRGIDTIRQMKSLKTIGISSTERFPADEFWKRYDASDFGKPAAQGSGVGVQDSEKGAKPWNTPAFQAWVKATQALPAEQQVEAASKKLMELNPGFDGKMFNAELKGQPVIANDVVTHVGFVTDNVMDISPVRALTELVSLTCVGAKGKFSDLSPLDGMRLRNVDCYFTLVSDLSPLKAMPLTILDCRNTQVSDLSPLRRMPLVTLDCGSTPVSDLTPLEDCKGLKELKIKSTKVTAAGVAALQKALPNCKIEWDDPKADDPKADSAKADRAKADDEQAKLTTLFNGRDLTGWTVVGPNDWKMLGGELVCSGSSRTYLYSQRNDYRDFHLHVEAKINEKGNSGIYFRCTPGEPGEHPTGYEAQISASQPDQRTGSLYNVVKIAKQLTPADTWFSMEVIAVGPRIRILVDGTPVVDYTDPNAQWSQGAIGLQQNPSNNANSAVRFRKLEIRELRPDDAR